MFCSNSFSLFLILWLVLSGMPGLKAQVLPEDIPVEYVNSQRVRFRLPNNNPAFPDTHNIYPGVRLTVRYLAQDQPLKGVNKAFSQFSLYESDPNSPSNMMLRNLNLGLDFFLTYKPDPQNPLMAYILIDLPAHSLPDSLSKLKVSGSLALMSDHQTAIDTTASVPLMIGELLQAGPYTFSIHELRKPDFSNDQLELTLVSDNKPQFNKDNILHIHFFDQAGKTIRTTHKGSVSINNYVKDVYSLNINPGRIVAEIVYIKNQDHFLAPVNLRLSDPLTPPATP
jgi:hypothetical protein